MLRKILSWIKLLFASKAKSQNGLIGYWTAFEMAVDGKTISAVLHDKYYGEMYSYEGLWIAGPNLKT